MTLRQWTLQRFLIYWASTLGTSSHDDASDTDTIAINSTPSTAAYMLALYRLVLHLWSQMCVSQYSKTGPTTGSSHSGYDSCAHSVIDHTDTGISLNSDEWEPTVCTQENIEEARIRIRETIGIDPRTAHHCLRHLCRRYVQGRCSDHQCTFLHGDITSPGIVFDTRYGEVEYHGSEGTLNYRCNHCWKSFLTLHTASAHERYCTFTW